MKRLSIILSLLMLASLVACAPADGSNGSESTAKIITPVAEAQTLTPTFTPTATITPTNTFTPTPTPTATLGIGSTQVSEKDGMTLLYVPAGEFTMGSIPSQAKRECDQFDSSCHRSWFENEAPAHTVDLAAFWIDQTEVTNAMYTLCVQAEVCRPLSKSPYYSDQKYADHPATLVLWYDAEAYCEWAGRRLPTEAEWEKAARGVNALSYPWGNNVPTCALLNMYDNSTKKNCVGNTTRPVGSYPDGASPYGALDMAGNALEWTHTWYNAYPGSTVVYSSYGTQYRVLRGGSWGSNGIGLRATYRSWTAPEFTNRNYGFRCARSD